jgi:filamentous hemagglutinin family protein
MNPTSAAIVRTLLLGTSCLSMLGLGLEAARAQPSGGSVVLGSATISDHGANLTTVTQTTGKAIINWNSFSIAAGGTVQFNQPGTSAITLNRVLGPETSAIYGNLLANGQVWLINRNGVLFGAGSKINVGGLIATTSDIADGDFASGNYAFAGGSGAAVTNQGTIRAAKGGSVVLSGASVSNRGLIEAETGTVVLGGARAFTVDFVGDGLIKYAIAAPTGPADNGQTGVSNSGTIAAQGGHVVMTARAAADVADAVVNNTGMISATSAKMQNGEVVLDAGGGDVNVSGTIDASGTGSGETGGSVAVTGRNVTVADNTKIDASGDAGGGNISIGGDAHGAGPLANAANTHVGTATITADAIHSGNGGKLVVWSNGLTDFSGIISARGGAAGGDGGFVETSGHTLNIGSQARVDTTAPKGQTGTWLLDPLKIVIANGGSTPLSGGMLAAGTDPGATDQVAPTTIITALATTNVTLQATDSITVQDPVIYSSSHDLNLMAMGDITANASIQNTQASGGGAINLVAGWDGSTAMASVPSTPGSWGNGSGTVTVGGFMASGMVAVGTASGALNVYSTNLMVDGSSAYAQLGYHGAGGGNILVNLTGDVNVMSGNDPSNFAAHIGNGSLTGSVGGNVTGDITMTVGGDTEFFGDATDSAWLGNAAAGGYKATGNVTALTRTGFFSPDFITADLGTSADTGGNVFIGFYDPISSPLSAGGLNFNSPHDFTFAGAGNLNIVGAVTNASTGAITLVAGWDGKTIGSAAQIEAAHAYGMNNALIAVGNDQQFEDVSVGTAGGLTTLLSQDLTVSPATGFFAQIGFHGANGGDTRVVVSGTLTLTGSSAANFAQIGNGTTFGSNTAGGAVTLVADTIVAGPNADATATALTLTLTGGQVGSSPSPLDIAANTLSLATTGGAAYLASPSLGVTLANVSTNGGAFTLSAAGPIGESGTLSSGALDVSTTSGAITLTNAANIFGPLTVSTQGSDSAALTSSGAIVVASANVGGTLTLTSAGGISQTGVIVAGGLTLSAGGGIVLTNGSNSFANLSVTTSGLNSATLTDAAAVTLGTSSVGGALALSAGGAIGQSGALTAHGLNLSTTAGGIALTNAANALTGTVRFSAPGSVTLYDAASPDIGASSIGGDFTVLAQGNVNFLSSLQLNSGNVIAVAGWNGTTTDPAQLGNSGVFGNGSGVITIGGSGAPGNVAVGSHSGSTSIYAGSFNIAGVHGYAQLGYHGSGGGGIVVRTLHDMTLTGSVGYAMIGNGSLTSDVVGAETGDIDIRLGGNANFNNAGAGVELGNVAHSGGETGNVILVMYDETDSGESDSLSQFIVADLQGGDFTVAFSGPQDQGPDHAINYNSSHTVNILIAGNAVIAGSIQNAGSGAINLVGGWDGHTLSGFGTAGVSGNGGHGVVIGGAQASGDVALGSAGGQTSVYGASLGLNAVNGFAQLGFNGHGSGAVLVNVSGGVTLSGGSATGAFAQIGNGGLKTSGNNSGDITITAGGDLALNGGSGGEAYAQIGQGGAEANTGSAAYSNTAALTVTAANVLLTAGGGSAANSMIGSGGYKAGQNLVGTAVNGGNITITSSHAVTLHGGATADTFAQIGNGGSQSNLNPSAAATGTDSGDIVVHAPNGAAGAVTLLAGAGANAYAQIGDGGYSVNAGPSAVAANFTVGGNVSVTDLALTGGNGGANAFAQIGNGDASLNSYGNVGGNIVIDANGKITLTDGTAPHSPAEIGNFTGFGTVSGTVQGVPPSNPIDAGALGAIVSNVANNQSNTNGISTINTVVVELPANGGGGGATNTPGGGSQGAIAQLDDGKDTTPPTTSDNATVVIADSLDGSKKPTVSETIIAGVLTQTNTSGFGQTAQGVPDVDQDFSSDGNGAFWQ